MRPLSFLSAMALLGLSALRACMGVCVTIGVSEDSFYAAATGNDVCKEYNASHVAYDYAMRGEDWATNPNKAWS